MDPARNITSIINYITYEKVIPHRYSFGTLRYWKGSLNWNERAMKRPSPKTTSNYQVKTLEPRSWVMITITITIRVFHLVGDYEGVRSISSFGHHGWPVTGRGRTITTAKIRFSISISMHHTHPTAHITLTTDRHQCLNARRNTTLFHQHQATLSSLSS